MLENRERWEGKKDQPAVVNRSACRERSVERGRDLPNELHVQPVGVNGPFSPFCRAGALSPV